MGATNCPETPRQRMITMMYLVYTAMLALNVSAEVVEGFRSVGTAMTKSNENLQIKLEDTYTNFESAYTNSPDKVRDKWEKAQEVQRLSRELAATIDSIEYSLIGKLTSEAKINTNPDNPKEVRTIKFNNPDGTVNLDSIKTAVQLGGFRWMEKGLDNTNDVTPFFLGSKAEGEFAAEGTTADLLKKSVLNYEHQVKQLLGEDSVHVTFGFNVDKKAFNKEKKLVSWEMLNFNEAVAGAALVTLVRMKAETMNTEFDAVNMLYKQVSKGDFSFDQVAMISRPKSTYIIKGGYFETDINVAAYDSKQSFTATVNGQQLTSNDSGSVHYKVLCNNEGPQKVTGTAYVKNPDGGTKEYPISENYFVAQPMAGIQLDNMLVVYAGIENPFTASVPGVDSRNVRVSVDAKDGKLIQVDNNGHYNVIPTGAAKNLMINVTAMIDGKPQNMGSLKFRVKQIPDPVIKVGIYENGAKKAARKDFPEGTNVVAAKAKDFDFKIKAGSMRVKTLNITVGTKTLAPIENSPRLNAEVASAIRKANRGDKLIVSATVMMPDGKPRDVECVITLAK